jgi:hypothetical protein
MKTQNKQSNILKKVFLALCISFLFCTVINAQDKITLKNGEEVNAKVIEINETEIKYKKSDNLEGPTRIFYKTDVFSIKYENGTKDVFSDEPVKTINNNTGPFYQNNSGPVKQVIVQKPLPIDNRFDKDSSDFAKVKHKRFDGPRVGVTYISQGTSADYLAGDNKQPLISQFGWQFEGRLFTIDGNTQGIVEFIPLIGGIEQGLFIPSASFLIGIRTGEKRTYEFAVGPNFSVNRDYNKDLVMQPGVVIAFGTSFKSGNINFPVNIALIPSVGSKHDVKDPVTETWSTKNFQTGWRLSFVVGFNSRKK